MSSILKKGLLCYLNTCFSNNYFTSKRCETLGIKQELDKAENAFSELEKAVSDGGKELDEGVKGRLEEFFDNLSDENSRINKAFKLVSNGTKKIQKLGQVYNKIGRNFGLPSVPPILLGKEEKD